MTELEEMASVTVQDAQGYLRRKHETINGIAYVCGTRVWVNSLDEIPALVTLLAQQEGRTPQEILREMNPRIRHGVPPLSVRLAHRDLPWFAQDEHGNPRVGFWTQRRPTGPWTFYVQGRGDLSEERVSMWGFWPLDRAGNKVPWST